MKVWMFTTALLTIVIGPQIALLVIFCMLAPMWGVMLFLPILMISGIWQVLMKHMIMALAKEIG